MAEKTKRLLSKLKRAALEVRSELSRPKGSVHKEIEASGLFDPVFYADHSPDVAMTGADLLDHYLRFGHAEGRWPNHRFDSAFYRDQHLADQPDANPLLHYLKEGRDRNLRTCKEHVNRTLIDASLANVIDLDRQSEAYNELRQLAVSLRLFDPEFYLQQYRDILETGVDAFDHYMAHGWREGREPSKLFEPEWYQNTYLGGELNVNPLQHFLLIGIEKGFSPIQRFQDSTDVRVLRRLSKYGLLASGEEPPVSVVIINFNGCHHLPDLFESLAEVDYPDLQIVVVDNASTDGSREWLAENALQTRIVKLDENIGFSDAANVGLDHCNAQLVTFLNNDTTVDRNWIRALVSALKGAPNTAVATSKVLFYKPFISLTLKADRDFSLHLPDLLAPFEYKKHFVETGTDYDSWVQSSDGVLSLKLPAEAGVSIPLKTYDPDSKQGVDVPLSLNLNGIPFKNAVQQDSFDLTPEIAASAGRWVINNAGSFEVRPNAVADRGFGQYDVGQFNAQEPLSHLCGCSFMINRTALRGKPVFIGDLFAYYEDTELAERLRQDGYAITYAPDSIVYHKHASTSVEKSVMFHRLVARNYSAFYGRKYGVHGLLRQISEKKGELSNRAKFLARNPESTDKEKALSLALFEVSDQLDHVARKFAEGSEFKGSHRSLRIGVYNEFWLTGGGGELHALNFALLLSEYAIVDLITSRDFDLDHLLERFQMNKSRFRKVIIRHISPADTQTYDVFVNSTFGSNLTSKAGLSYYIVSFPHKVAPEEFKRSYLFLANSGYTEKWLKTYWGDAPRTRVLNPLVTPWVRHGDLEGKRPVILNVGRYFPDAHCKMQHECVETFKQLIDENPDMKNWKLVCAGGLEETREDSKAYFDQVQSAAEGYNIEVLANVSADKLKALLAEASIYWHATGFGRDINDDPSTFEHFGIATAEAMGAGCVPVVLNAGGQADVVGADFLPSCFSDRAEWTKNTLNWMQMFEADHEGFVQAGAKAAAASERFQDEAFRNSARSIIEDVQKLDDAITRTRGTPVFDQQAYWRLDNSGE